MSKNPMDNYRASSEQAPAPTAAVPRLIQMLDSDKVKKGIAAVVGKNMSADRMTRLMVNAVHKTPALLQCDPKTVLGAFMTSAALGLEPNTPQGLAYLIPYKRRANVDGKWIDVFDCQFQIGYKGFVTLAGRAGIQIQAGAIHSGDVFDYCLGSETFLKYKVQLLADRGDLVGAFAYSQTDMGQMATVLPLSEIHKIRAKSETYTSLQRKVKEAPNAKDREKAEARLAETPWVMWEDDMAAKSAIKKHSKLLPLGMALSVAAELDSQAEAGVLDLSAMADPDRAMSLVEDGDVPIATQQALAHEPAERMEGLEQVQGETQAEPERETVSRSRGGSRSRSQQRQAPVEDPAPETQPAADGRQEGPAGDEPPPYDDDMFNAE